VTGVLIAGPIATAVGLSVGPMSIGPGNCHLIPSGGKALAVVTAAFRGPCRSAAHSPHHARTL
jgi:hypothetical protein